MKTIIRLLGLLAVVLLPMACHDDNDKSAYVVSIQMSDPVVNNVSETSAIVTATVAGKGLIARGLCYSTAPNPTVNDDKVSGASANMLVTLVGLKPNTTYHVRAFYQTSYDIAYSKEVEFTTGAESYEEEPQTEWPSELRRVSVHDPSVVFDPASSTYYVFGSHKAAAKSTNMMSWEAFTVSWATETGSDVSNEQAFTTPQVTKVKKGGQEFDLNFDALAWSKRGSANYSIDGMMWAPDVIYNKAMGKWCMYLSINGDSWYSSVIMLTADQISGPYRYQAPVVIGGFSSGDSYKDTDLEVVLGSQSSLPGRYDVGTGWGNRYPNCIDPCVFYDEEGKLLMSYGSWSGGIWMLELDENTGLRDYDVTYNLTGSGDGVTEDPYFGKKIAGGHYASGEASYIEFIRGYYYLFVTYGGLAAGGVADDYNNGGYQMRVFRSQKPDGPYYDSHNGAAIYNQYRLNFGPKANDGNRGVNIFGAYSNWGNLLTGAYGEASGERSQGHNSIIAAADGRIYLVYHTRFQNWGEGHQLRVHQVYQNEDGWLVASPFEYTGEKMKSGAVAALQKIPTAQVPGKYKVMVHEYKLDHTAKAFASPKEVILNADGTITGEYEGSWSVKEGTSYITINIGQVYNGVMIEQTLEPSNDKAPCFTGLNSQTGVTLWGYKYAEN